MPLPTSLTQEQHGQIPRCHYYRWEITGNIPVRYVTGNLPVSYHKLLKHINPVLHSLHWLKIENRIVYKLISLTYTAVEHNSTAYLANKLELQSNCTTRSATVIILRRPPVKLETGKRSFSSAAPFLCNSLLTRIRQSASITHSRPHQHIIIIIILLLIIIIIIISSLKMNCRMKMIEEI